MADEYILQSPALMTFFVEKQNNGLPQFYHTSRHAIGVRSSFISETRTGVHTVSGGQDKSGNN